MSLVYKVLQIARSTMLVALLACAGDSSAVDLFWKIKPDYEGTVREMTTGLPLEGVYVLAVYNGGGGSMFGHSATWCVKTRGVYSGKDGSFRLPREPEGDPEVEAIKIGYLTNWKATFKARKKAGGEAVGPPYHFEVEPQIPGKTKSSQFIRCERPKSRADAEANIKYLKILLEEVKLYEPGGNFIETLEQIIISMESPKSPLTDGDGAAPGTPDNRSEIFKNMATKELTLTEILINDGLGFK